MVVKVYISGISGNKEVRIHSVSITFVHCSWIAMVIYKNTPVLLTGEETTAKGPSDFRFKKCSVWGYWYSGTRKWGAEGLHADQLHFSRRDNKRP